MNEEKTTLYTRKHPAFLTAGFNGSGSGHGKGRRGGGIRGRSPRLHCEGDMRKQFEASLA